MKKKAGKYFGFLLAVILVVALASMVDSMVDMDSEYKQITEELEALRFRMNQGMSIGMTRDELDKLTRPTGSLSYWVGVQKADYVPEGEDCGAEEWLPLVVRNNGCPDCDWFSVIAHLPYRKVSAWVQSSVPSAEKSCGFWKRRKQVMGHEREAKTDPYDRPCGGGFAAACLPDRKQK